MKKANSKTWSAGCLRHGLPGAEGRASAAEGWVESMSINIIGDTIVRDEERPVVKASDVRVIGRRIDTSTQVRMFSFSRWVYLNWVSIRASERTAGDAVANLMNACVQHRTEPTGDALLRLSQKWRNFISGDLDRNPARTEREAREMVFSETGGKWTACSSHLSVHFYNRFDFMTDVSIGVQVFWNQIRKIKSYSWKWSILYLRFARLSCKCTFWHKRDCFPFYYNFKIWFLMPRKGNLVFMIEL